MISEQQITEALKAVKYPGYSRDIVSFGIVKHIAANNGAVSVTSAEPPVGAFAATSRVLPTS